MCQCHCGKKIIRDGNALDRKRVISCGCARGKDLVGFRFGNRTVLNRVFRKNQTHEREWLCKCDCGSEKILKSSSILNGKRNSCGCIGKERQRKKVTVHGQASGKIHTGAYTTWGLLKHSCYCESCENYKNFGGKGLLLCKRWKKSFLSFFKDMGNKPKNSMLALLPEKTIYCKKNCRWIKKRWYTKNRPTKLLKYKRRLLTPKELAEKMGLSAGVVSNRLGLGWSVDRIVQEKLHPNVIRDIVGKKFGKWTVVKFHGIKRTASPHYLWQCKCDCGKERIIDSGSLKSGISKSCGCLRSGKTPDLLNKRFGRLTVIKQIINGKQDRSWFCRCDCGNEKVIRTCQLRGSIKSCGCLLKEHFLNLVGKKFGKWTVIRPDFVNKNHQKYWLCQCSCGTAKSIVTSSLTTGGSKSCGCNKGTRYVNFRGKRLSLYQWSKETGIEKACLSARLKHGWSIKKALTQETARRQLA